MFHIRKEKKIGRNSLKKKFISVFFGDYVINCPKKSWHAVYRQNKKTCLIIMNYTRAAWKQTFSHLPHNILYLRCQKKLERKNNPFCQQYLFHQHWCCGGLYICRFYCTEKSYKWNYLWWNWGKIICLLGNLFLFRKDQSKNLTNGIINFPV